MRKTKFLILFLVLVVGLVLGGCGKDKVQVADFESCVEAGNPVMESCPRQCRAEDGQVFVEEVDVAEPRESGEPVDLAPVEPGDGVDEPELPGTQPPDSSCKDVCGDGICQEIVCMAIGCPCAESKMTCPEDCG